MWKRFNNISNPVLRQMTAEITGLVGVPNKHINIRFSSEN